MQFKIFQIIITNLEIFVIRTFKRRMKYVRIKQKEIKESGISVNDIELPKIKEEKKEVKDGVRRLSYNSDKLKTYYEIGKLLNEAGGKYGDNIINEYSKKLVIEVGKKYNRRTLFRMRQFYRTFSNEKVSTLSTQLSWSHYSELLSIKNADKLSYYLNLSIIQNIGVRELREKIKSKEYERLSDM